MGDSLAVSLKPEELPAGEVLMLRRWTASMIDQLLESIETSQPELARWLAWADPMPTRTAELEVVANAERAFAEDRDYPYFFIERASGDLVCCAGLHPKTGGVVEIGYWVRSDRAGRYATSAAGSLCRAAFTYRPEAEKVIIRITLTLAHEEHLDDVVAGYGGDVEIDVIRAYWSLRSLMEIRWLVEQGYGAPATFPQVAVLNSLSASS
jgi:RimJ/RimL family protein N-acetyltransferase